MIVLLLLYRDYKWLPPGTHPDEREESPPVGHRLEEMYLVFVAHRSSTKDGHFGQRLLLQSLKGVAFGTEQLSDEIELRRNSVSTEPMGGRTAHRRQRETRSFPPAAA